MKLITIILTLTIFFACDRLPDSNIDDSMSDSELYFPPIIGDEWSTTSIDSLGWDSDALEELLDFLEDSESRAFIILKNGKIVVEEYWNKTLLAGNFDQNSNWYWASAGKTVTSFLVGQAIDEGKIDIDAPSSTYLGKGWSSLTEDQEENIKVKHHLSMTTGLDDKAGDVYCTDPECLTFKAPAGTRWAYHNGPYTILDRLISNGTGESFDDFFESRLRDKIGMDGFWMYQGFNHIFYSTARSMARFGLLVSAGGEWAGEPILADEDYLFESTNTSQDINKSYGYLWWLNGKSSYMLPSIQLKIPGSITPNAPDDMYAAMGKNGQLINIVPSEGLVVVRMGGNPDFSFVPTKFQDEIWVKLMKVIE